MKFVSVISIEEVPELLRKVEKPQRPIPKEAVEMVNSFYEASKGPKCVVTLDLFEEGEPWPTRETYEGMDTKRKSALRSIVKGKMFFIEKELLRRIKKDNPHLLGRMDLKRYYLGGGKVALYWSPKKRKVKHGSQRSKIAVAHQG